MTQMTFSVRMDADVKKEFDSLCNIFGMNASTAFNIFARTVVREKKIPFEITASDNQKTQDTGRQVFRQLREEAQQNGLQDISLDEINQEIAAARNEYK